MNDETILLAHGSGSRLSHELIEKNFLLPLANPLLAKLDDSAVFELSGRLAFTTDSYVVSPIFFPGGDIGKLAVCGTINDLAMSGAKPLYLSLSFIIEEGLTLSELSKIVKSIKAAAEEAGVKIITGDTKVVNRGSADKLFINTSGIGIVPEGIDISGDNAKVGDKVILSGNIGDHGIAVMSQREGLKFSVPVQSDCAPLNKLVSQMLEASSQIHCMRDPTRGGLATTLNELAKQSKVGIKIEEGLTLSELSKIVKSIKAAAEEAGVKIITGDTKVVNRGSADKLFINTSGIGIVPEGIDISGDNAKVGDKVILSGNIGDHGIAVMSQREGLKFSVPVQSDCAPLNKLVSQMLEASSHIHCMRDPTRGGLATTLNELARQSKVGIKIEEEKIPVRDGVRAACELLGFDPLYVANEGKLVAIVAPSDAEKVLAKMKRNRYGTDASIIGEVTDEHKGKVIMKTRLGASRIVDMLSGELLPRIC